MTPMADIDPLALSPTLGAAAGITGAPLMPGDPVGEYVVGRRLGAGAMGEVYAGTHPVIGKKVAIKVLRPELGASVEGVERFKREARAANAVEHPNVVDVFGFGRLPDGRLYLVMDLVEGQSLRRALAGGPLPLPAALHVLGAIADALDAAHARGVVHRDLKPDNVMIGTGAPPAVAVLDFGLAKVLTSDDAGPQAALLTGKGSWLGTPAYMAPEQWSADGAGPASDRYALGVVAFELLTGALPFQAGSLPQMMEQHFRAKVPLLAAAGAPTLSPGLDAVLARAMGKSPLERFPSARVMVEALRAASIPGHAVGAGSAPRRALVPAIAGGVVLAASVVGVLAVRGRTATRRPSVRPALAADRAMVTVGVASSPAGAEVRRDGALVGLTPTRLEIAARTELALELRKPGYAPLRHTVHVHEQPLALPPLALVEVRGFEGVWALPTGELRAFARRGEHVEVSKLTSVHGERVFFRHYPFVTAEAGVAFASTEELVEPAAPDEPSCHIPRATTYLYEPATDALSASAERVRYDLLAGRCIVTSRGFDPPLVLARADRPSVTERETVAPVGVPRTPSTRTGEGKRSKAPLRKGDPTQQNASPSSVPTPSVKPSAVEQSKAAPPTQKLRKERTTKGDLDPQAAE